MSDVRPVLVILDESNALGSLVGVLENAGYAVETIADAKVGFDDSASTHYSAIIRASALPIRPNDLQVITKLNTCQIEILHAINSVLNTNEMLQCISSLLKDLSGCDAVGIRLKDGNDYPYYETSGFSNDFVEHERHLCAWDEHGNLITDKYGNPVIECNCGSIIKGEFDPSLPVFTDAGSFWTNSTTDFIMSDIDNFRTRGRNRCNTAGYESVALIPLRVADQTLGLLQFNAMRRNCFSLELINILENVAQAIGTALARRNAQEAFFEAYTREHHIADVLQHALIPELSFTLPGYDIAARYHPALKEAEVGGDFYDIFKLSNGKVMLVMGDVSGKGLEAAVYTAMVKYMLRAYAYETPDPEKVLNRLNNAFCQYAPEDMFVTAFCGILDPESSELEYASAGHDPAVFYDAALDQVSVLENPGRVLGIMDYGSCCARKTLKFTPGSILIIYTDGITDARRDEAVFGIEGLTETLTAYIQTDENEIADIILESASRSAGGALRDDAAVLVIKAK